MILSLISFLKLLVEHDRVLGKVLLESEVRLVQPREFVRCFNDHFARLLLLLIMIFVGVVSSWGN